MRKFLFLTLVISIISCNTDVKKVNSTTTQKTGFAIVSGTIKESFVDKITLRSQYNSSEKIEIPLVNNTFSDTIKLDTPGFYTLFEGENSVNLFLSDNDNININFNSNNLANTLEITGDNAATNLYLIDKEKLNTREKIVTQDLYSFEEEEFIKILTELKAKQKELLNKKDGLAIGFKENELKNIDYEYLSALSNFEQYHPYFAEKKEFQISENSQNTLDNIDLNNENDFQFSTDYRKIIVNSLRTKAENLVKKDTILFEFAYLKAIGEIANEKIKNKLVFDEVKYGIMHTTDLEKYYNTYKEISTNTANDKNIESDIAKIKALAKGQDSPKFTDYENFEGGKTSLKDLEGNYIFINIWATWCDPCIEEIQALSMLEKQYKNKKIAFVHISIDEKHNREKWRNMVEENDVTSMHLFADNSWSSQFIEDYMIKGIPRFILIDPKGKIVDANAPRPSEKRIIEFLNDLKL